MEQDLQLYVKASKAHSEAKMAFDDAVAAVEKARAILHSKASEVAKLGKKIGAAIEADVSTAVTHVKNLGTEIAGDIEEVRNVAARVIHRKKH